MKKIFETLLRNIEKGEPVVLAALTKSEGSVPRGAGAYMVVGKGGLICGTIGGGNLEYMAISKAKELIGEKKSLLRKYSLEQGKSELGMVCGGRAEVLFYYVDEKDRDFAEEGLKAAKGRRPYYVCLPFEEGLGKISYDDPADPQKFYIEKSGSDGRVFIFGGGHVGRELARLLKMLDFYVVVVDDREEFADPERFPQADEVLLCDFENIHIDIRENDYIAIMTRGHKGDFECERFALSTPAKYIGVMGSKSKTEFVKKRLMSCGITEKETARVEAPIGIDIGSVTPTEIAVSIAASLIKKRAETY